MKTKNRSANFTVPSQSRVTRWDSISNPNYGTNVSGGSVSGNTWVSLNETIAYNEPRKKCFGSCTHTRVFRQIFPTPHVYRSGVDPNATKTTRDAYYHACTYPTWAGYSSNLVLGNVNWKALSAQAMDEMMPTFSEGGESLVNFMLELKQLKDLFHLWNRSRGFLKNISGAHLNVSFGWRPFLSDVERLRGALRNFQKKLRRLQEEANKPLKRHYRRFTDLVSLPTNNPATDASGIHRIETRWIQRPVYCATVQYSYVMPDMSLVSNQIKGFLDSLGVQWNPSIIWNAIPYSFVVDWFFNVGDWLNQLRSDNLQIPATVTDFCHSIKFEYRDSYFHKPASTYAPDGVEVEMSMCDTLRYERRKDIPSFGLLDQTVKAPNWSQILLGGSLIVQRA